MLQRVLITILLGFMGSSVMANDDYSSQSPNYERHKQHLEIYLHYGGSLQACAVLAYTASVMTTAKFEVLAQNHSVDGEIDVEGLIKTLKKGLRPPDPFMNAMMGALYVLASDPDLLKKYRFNSENHGTPEKRSSIVAKVMENNCSKRSSRKQIGDRILEGYVQIVNL